MKKAGIVIAVLLLIGAIVYSGAWFCAKQRIDAEIARLFDTAAQQNITFLGDKPEVTGFPFAPTIHYTKGIKVRNWDATFATLTIKGFPLPGLPVKFSFPEGVMVSSSQLPDIVMVEELYALIRIPLPLLNSFYEDDIRVWQQAGGTLDIIDSFVRYEGAILNIDGTIAVDENLQPIASLKAQTRGYALLIQKMIEAEKIKPFAGIALLAALNNFAKPDPDSETGEMIAEMPLTVQNRSLYVGPVLAGSLPEILWDKRNPPALRQ
jgi:hypothetical protein